jgi:hypothetical protein
MGDEIRTGDAAPGDPEPKDIDEALTIAGRLFEMSKDPNFWRALTGILTAIGLTVDPTRLTLILAAGGMAISIIEMIRREQRAGEKPLSIAGHVWAWATEASTRRGLIGLLTSFGVFASPGHMTEFLTVGGGIITALEATRKLKK